jgi:hypothetical protein
VEGFVLTVGAKFATHLNSYSQPSAKLVVLFPETDDSLHAAFFRNISVPHGSPLSTRSITDPPRSSANPPPPVTLIAAGIFYEVARSCSASTTASAVLLHLDRHKGPGGASGRAAAAATALTRESARPRSIRKDRGQCSRPR